jgi:EAL and modified HD-GYP domain-containing signal transduction protein
MNAALWKHHRPGRQAYVARQPIFDTRSAVFGYELLYRSCLDANHYQAEDDDLASLAVISDSAFVFGLETLAGTGRAFVNFTRNSLVREYARVLPPDRLVVEVLETVVPDKAVVAACERLKDRGYLIALDDFVLHGPTRGLAELADIVKIDFAAVRPDDRARIADLFLPRGVQLLAEKVESAEDAREARRLGCSYTQGYYFARPEISVGSRFPGFKPHRIQILRELNRADADLDRLEDLLRHDPALAYQLIRYLNSAAFGLRSRITTVRQAVVYLGLAGLRTWVTVLILADVGVDHPLELIVRSVERGRFCELLGLAAGLEARRHDISLLGLFSLIDAIIRRPLDEALAEVPLADDVAAAIRGQPNELGNLLALAKSYERAEWPAVERLVGRLALDHADVPAMYLEAIAWGNRGGFIR